MRFIIHMVLHFLVPALVALAVTGWRRRRLPDPTSALDPSPQVPWRDALRPWMIMMATMLVDLDHLVADPILDPGRCSLGFHPLHTLPAIAVYVVLTALPRWRWWGIGLLIHMALDGLDCLLMS